jgi:hypothetical protein
MQKLLDRQVTPAQPRVKKSQSTGGTRIRGVQPQSLLQVADRIIVALDQREQARSLEVHPWIEFHTAKF